MIVKFQDSHGRWVVIGQLSELEVDDTGWVFRQSVDGHPEFMHVRGERIVVPAVGRCYADTDEDATGRGAKVLALTIGQDTWYAVVPAAGAVYLMNDAGQTIDRF